MLHVQSLHKSYGATTVLDGVSFLLGDRERVGLVGPNGAGKSTLLRCLVGLEAPDGGSVVFTPAGARLGYLPQSFGEEQPERTLAEVVSQAQADLVEAEHALQVAAEALAGPPAEADAALAAYDLALARFEALGGYQRQARTAAVLDGLRLSTIAPETPLGALSGGQKTRLGLACLLLTEPAVLLLDEPTNHLDVTALEWLEEFLVGYPHAVLLVSHDRALLDRTVERILYLDPDTRAVRSYPGGYTDFALARARERQQQADAWRQQQEYTARVERDIGRLKSAARSIELSTTARQPGLRTYARKKAALAKAREKKLERYLASDERVERPKLRWPIKLDFGAPPPSGQAVLRLEDVSFSFFPGGPPLLEHVTFDVRYGQRVALVGPNGAGKTTLLRLIEGKLGQPTAGRIQLGANVRLGFLAQEHETLDPGRSVLETVLRARPMSEQEARDFLPAFLFSGDSVFRPVGACSLGERSRLQLAVLVLQGCNLLLLDEPLNHLDVEAREHFEAALEAFQGTVLVVAHDRTFLRRFARRILQVDRGRVSVFEAGYTAFRAAATP